MEVEVQHTMNGNTKVGYKFPKQTWPALAEIWNIPGPVKTALSGHVDNESFTNKAGFEFITTEGDMAESEMAHTWNRADKIYDFSLEKKLFGREVCGCTVNVQVSKYLPKILTYLYF